jgi:hypothetical protein
MTIRLCDLHVGDQIMLDGKLCKIIELYPLEKIISKRILSHGQDAVMLRMDDSNIDILVSLNDSDMVVLEKPRQQY